MKIVCLNNGGIGGSAVAMKDHSEGDPWPPGVLSQGARYDKMMEAFGGFGAYIEDPTELKGALEKAMAFDGPAVVNVQIDPAAGRKPQQFGWLTT